MPWMVKETRDAKFIWDITFDPSVLPGLRVDKMPSIQQLVDVTQDKNRYWYQCGKGGLVCFFPNQNGTVDIHIAFKSGNRGVPARVATRRACAELFKKLEWLPRIEAKFSGIRKDVARFLFDCGFHLAECGGQIFGYIERKSLWAI